MIPTSLNRTRSQDRMTPQTPPRSPVAPHVAGARLVLLGLLAGCTASWAGEMQVGRYSIWPVTATRAQVAPLSAIVAVRFPRPVQTVEQAVQHLLDGSGYRLAGAPDSPAAIMLAQPLPKVHRSLGPLPLDQALQTLAGPVFQLVQDPLHRRIAFELCTQPDP